MNHQLPTTELEAVARSAGEVIMQVYCGSPHVQLKTDGSPVTAADRAAEKIILEALASLAPRIAVISEENERSHGLAAPDRFFLVDPLDGTKEFLKKDKAGAFTVNIALIENGRPVLGVVYAPALDRLFTGIAGTGASEICSGERRTIAVRKTAARDPVAVASSSHRDDATERWLADHGIKNTISIGSSLKFCLLACGEADVYPRFGTTMEWDTAAGDAVLRAAGGFVVTPDNRPFAYGKPGYRNGPFIASADRNGCGL